MWRVVSKKLFQYSGVVMAALTQGYLREAFRLDNRVTL